MIRLCRFVLFHDPTRDCLINHARNDWRELPLDKSLFHSRPGRGLPVGNLTSQVFANFHLNPFDHFVKHTLGVRCHGRYVDDFLIVHVDRTKTNAHAAINAHNLLAGDHKPDREERRQFQSSIHSYLGIMKHYATVRLRTRQLERVSPWWWRTFRTAGVAPARSS